MAILLDESGVDLLDEALGLILDEAGAPVNVNGLVANVTIAALTGSTSTSVAGHTPNVAVAAPTGAASGAAIVFGQVASVTISAVAGVASGGGTQTLVNVESVSTFNARTAVTAQATMEFKAGQPVQAGLRTLAADQWFSMYPG